MRLNYKNILPLLLAPPVQAMAFVQEDSLLASTQSTTFRLVALAILFTLFVLMVGAIFRRYRQRKSNVIKRNDSLSDQLGSDTYFAFSPTVNSGDSSPAVLVAHMDLDKRLFITNTLRLNYRVISTSDGDEAFEKAYELVPDLVITDVHLPTTNGYQLTRRLKNAEATSHIPVILLDADFQNNKKAALADDCITGAFDARDLLLRVHTQINNRRQRHRQYRSLLVQDEDAGMELQEHYFLFKLKRVLKMYYGDPVFGVEQLTDQLHMSRLQLVRKLKALMHFSPNEVIRFYRVEQAKQMLTEEVPVVEVAQRTGFVTAAAFVRAFRESADVEPEEFALRASKRNVAVKNY